MGDRSTRELFVDLTARPRRRSGALASLVAHGLGVAVLVLVPLLQDVPLPPPARPPRVFFADAPPPPPPPPLRYGTTRRHSKPVATPKVEPPSSIQPVPLVEPPVEAAQPVDPPAPADQPGAPTGTESGSLEGSEYGVAGGVPDGVPGGELGGALGGTIGGTGIRQVPERHYDRAPVLLLRTRPAYPHEAFVRKIEGRVLLEILIDSNGRVVGAKVVQSSPLFDAAACETVRQWQFAPAMKDGRPVAALALAPITFQIY